MSEEAVIGVAGVASIALLITVIKTCGPTAASHAVSPVASEATQYVAKRTARETSQYVAERTANEISERANIQVPLKETSPSRRPSVQEHSVVVFKPTTNPRTVIRYDYHPTIQDLSLSEELPVTSLKVVSFFPQNATEFETVYGYRPSFLEEKIVKNHETGININNIQSLNSELTSNGDEEVVIILAHSIDEFGLQLKTPFGDVITSHELHRQCTENGIRCAILTCNGRDFSIQGKITLEHAMRKVNFMKDILATGPISFNKLVKASYDKDVMDDATRIEYLLYTLTIASGTITVIVVENHHK